MTSAIAGIGMSFPVFDPSTVGATTDVAGAAGATGDLKDVHDYMIAANEASLATQMVVTLKNQAVSAFNEIMRMPV